MIDVDKNNPVLSIATPDDSVCEVRTDIESNRGALWLGDISCDKGDFVWQEAKGTQERDDEKIFALNLLLISAAARRRSCPISPLITRTITVRETAQGCLV